MYSSEIDSIIDRQKFGILNFTDFEFGVEFGKIAVKFQKKKGNVQRLNSFVSELSLLKKWSSSWNGVIHVEFSSLYLIVQIRRFHFFLKLIKKRLTKKKESQK